MKSLRRRSITEIDWQQIHTRLSQAATATLEALQPAPERAAALLDERARRLARPLAAQRPAGVMLDLLEFKLSGERYGIETRYVQEVLRFAGLTPVPGVSDLVAGVANLRGQILVVFDIRPLFGLAPQDVTDASRIVVCGNAQDDLGILVDSAHDVTCVPADELQSNEIFDRRNAANFIRGITVEAIIVLDGSVLLTDRRLFVDQPRPQ